MRYRIKEKKDNTSQILMICLSATLLKFVHSGKRNNLIFSMSIPKVSHTNTQQIEFILFISEPLFLLLCSIIKKIWNASEWTMMTSNKWMSIVIYQHATHCSVHFLYLDIRIQLWYHSIFIYCIEQIYQHSFKIKHNSIRNVEIFCIIIVIISMSTKKLIKRKIIFFCLSFIQIYFWWKTIPKIMNIIFNKYTIL